MINKVKFSVIVPVYKVEELIKECIDSIMAQTFGDFEVICVDDKSPDNSMKYVRECAKKDPRIKIHVQPKNKGLGAARNDGVKLAKGEYIVFVDSDDYIHKDMLLNLADRLKDEPDAIFFDARVVSTDYKETELNPVKTYYVRTGKYKKIDKGTNYFNLLVKNGDYIHSAWLWCVKKDFLAKNNIKCEEGKLHEDVVYTLNVFMKAEKIAYISKRLYNYRVRNNSITNSKENFKPRLVGMLTAYNRIREHFYSSDIDDSVKESLLVLQEDFLKTIHYIDEIIDTPFSMGDSILDYSAKELNLKCYYEHKQEEADAFVDKEVYMKGFRESIREAKKIIIYGAGVIGIRTLRFINILGYGNKICCFAVTNKDTDSDIWVENKKVYSIFDIKGNISEDTMIIAAGNRANRKEMKQKLDELQLSNSVVINDIINSVMVSNKL